MKNESNINLNDKIPSSLSKNFKNDIFDKMNNSGYSIIFASLTSTTDKSKIILNMLYILAMK